MLSSQVTFQLQPARVYLEDTFVYYIKTLFHTYIPDCAIASATERSRDSASSPILPEQVLCSKHEVFVQIQMRLNVTTLCRCCYMSMLKLVFFLPGASVGAGVGSSCAAAETDHPTSQPAGQRPCLPEAVHRFRPHASLLLPV